VAELIKYVNRMSCVQMVNARRSAAQSCQPPPPLVCLEINEVGIKMSERTQVKYGGDISKYLYGRIVVYIFIHQIY